MLRLRPEAVMNGLLEFCTFCCQSFLSISLASLWFSLEAQAGLGLGNLLIYLSIYL